MRRRRAPKSTSPTSGAGAGPPPQLARALHRFGGCHTGRVAARSAVVGREEELSQLCSLLAADGPRGFFLAAEPGMGKTTVVAEFLEAARVSGARVLRGGPLQVEAGLSFAGLTDVLDDVEPFLIDRLPVPQRRAVRVALLLEEEGPVDPRALAAGVRSMLRRMAPVIVVIDDAQWLDEASRAVLAGALRRQDEADVRVVVASRPVVHEPWLPETTLPLFLSPLDTHEVFDLVKNHLGIALDRSRLHRITATSGGNPLFALELARHHATGSTESRGLDELIGGRIRALPRATRGDLLAAALAGTPRADLIGRCRGVSTVDLLERLEPAEAAGLIKVGGLVEFVHPLYAAAAVDSASASERSACHAALSEIDPDVEAQARHLAAAYVGSDPELAGRLDAAAQDARARGAWETAAELLQLALDHTPRECRDQWGPRAVQLGEWYVSGGRVREAEEILRSVAAADIRDDAHWRALVQLALLCGTSARYGEANVFSAALHNPAVPAIYRAECLIRVDAAASLELTLTHLEEAKALLADLGPTRQVRRLSAEALMMKAKWSRQQGIGRRLDLLAEASSLQEATPPQLVMNRAEYALGQDALFTDRHDEARRYFIRLLDEADEVGDDLSLPIVLGNLAHLEIVAGRWDRAAELIDEAARISQGQGNGYHLVIECLRGWLLGLRGDLHGGLALIESARPGLEALGDAFWCAIQRATLSWVYLAHGRYLEAYTASGECLALTRTIGWMDPADIHLEADHLEAALALGHVDYVAASLPGLDARATVMERPGVLAACGRVRVSLIAAQGRLDQSVAAIPQMLEDFEIPHRQPLERGRAHLTAGKVLRRAKAKRRAHQQLSHALEIFENLDCPPWAAQARAERARVGMRQRSADELTDTERHVGQLAASGLRNADIASAAFISVKSVEAILGRTYRKLGIRGRAELGRALDDA